MSRRDSIIPARVVGRWIDARLEARPVEAAVDLIVDSELGSHAYRLTTEDASRLGADLAKAATFAVMERDRRARKDESDE